MKNSCILFALIAVGLSGCSCPDCGSLVGFFVNTTNFLISGDENVQSSNPHQIVLKSGYAWTATNLKTEYIAFADTEGIGGVSHFTPRLTPAFFAALANNPLQFVIDGIGCQVGQIRFESSQGDRIDVTVYLAGAILLSFNANGAQGSPPPAMVVIAGEDFLMPGDNGMTHPDAKTFAGWGTAANGTGLFCAANKASNFSAGAELFALWSGDGTTVTSPLYIYDRATLLAVEATVTNPLYYLVVADFDANFIEGSAPSPSWKPLGSAFSKFNGNFDGNGHTITYTIDDNTNQYLGLFAFIETGKVKDLSVAGSVKGTNSIRAYYGGIAGQSTGHIEGCYSAVSVRSESVERSYSGGIAGINSGTIIACVTTGHIASSVTGASSTYYSYSGGIVGLNYGNTSMVSYCVSTSSVESSSTAAEAYAGGIFGANDVDGKVANCVALNAPTTPGGWSIHANAHTTSHVGRVAGWVNDVDLTGAYADEGIVLWEKGSLFSIPWYHVGSTARSGLGVMPSLWTTKAWWEGLGATWASLYGDFEEVVTLGYPLPIAI